MRKKIFMFILIGLVMFTVACASKPLWKSEPHLQQASNDYFDATISPIYIFNSYKGFILNIHNKTTDSITVDWSNTSYVYNGKKQGGFWFEGIPYGEKNKPVLPDIVAGVIFTKEIYPAELTTLSQMAGAYVHEDMKAGENGVHLTVLVEGNPISETLVLNLSVK